jgi:hypothetical protein
VVGGRPLYCSKGLLKVPKPSETLLGHLTINNIRMGIRQREEQVLMLSYEVCSISFLCLNIFAQPLFFLQKKAVSTSHCSQPNTMEYDLALDWMLVRAKQETKFRTLHKVCALPLEISVYTSFQFYPYRP